MTLRDNPFQSPIHPVTPPGYPWEGDERELVQAIVEESRTLHWWGATQSIVRHLPGLIGPGPFARPVTFLDVGIGNSTLAIAIVRWCRSRDIPVRVHGLEFHPAAVQLARNTSEEYPEIEVDLADPRFETGVTYPQHVTNGQYDFVVASQVLHYFPQPQRRELIRYLYSIARSAFLVGEIVKHPAVYTGLWLWTRIACRSRILRTSILEGVTNSETSDGWRQLFSSIGIPVLEIYPHWPSLICIIAPKLLEESQARLSVLDAVPSVAPTG